MGATIDSGNMFNRFNTNYATDGKGKEVLDANEIAKAKQAGFDFFELKENMTKDEFLELYQNYETGLNEAETAEYEQKQKAVHVKYLQIQYATNEPIRDGEDISHYEERLKTCANQNSNENSKPAIAKKDMGI